MLGYEVFDLAEGRISAFGRPRGTSGKVTAWWGVGGLDVTEGVILGDEPASMDMACR